jgi:hypothetical protein
MLIQESGSFISLLRKAIKASGLSLNADTKPTIVFGSTLKPFNQFNQLIIDSTF